MYLSRDDPKIFSLVLLSLEKEKEREREALRDFVGQSKATGRA